jgi:tetratricopeptide (TPR) repeat protein
MENNSISSAKISLDDIFSQHNKYTFVGGSGISHPQPTCLPSGNVLIESFFDRLIPHEERKNITGLYAQGQKVNFDKVIDLVQKYLDPELSFIDNYDKKDPNHIHQFMAAAMTQGHYVVTTNFDCMIEKALCKITDDRNRILPVITKEDFHLHSDPESEYNRGTYPLYKIHGSNTHFISGKSTKESLGTTMPNLGREDEMKTFSIAPFKKAALHNLTKDSCLVVMGYSGGDVFDISPSLIEMNKLSTLIWIDHRKELSSNHAIIQRYSEEYIFDRNNSNDAPHKKLFQDLLRKAKKRSRKLQIYDVQVDTSNLVKEYLFTLIDKSKSAQKIHTSNSEIKECEQIQFGTQGKTISKSAQYDAACWIYYDLNDMNSVKRCAELGLNLAEIQNEPKNQIIFLRWLGMVSRFNKEFQLAHLYFKKAAHISKDVNDKNEYSIVLNEIGKNFEYQEKYVRAMKYYKRALKSLGDQGDAGLKSAYINNIANIQAVEHDLGKALHEYEKEVEIDKQIKDYTGAAFALLNVATTKYQLAKSFTEKENAMLFCDEAIAYAAKQGDLLLKARCLTRQCTMCDLLHLYDKEIDTLEEVLEIYRALNYSEGIADTLLNIGATLYSQNSFEEALEKYKESLKIFEDLKNESRQAELHHYIAGVYYAMQNSEEALMNEECAFNIANTLHLSSKSTYKQYMDVIRGVVYC